MIEQSTSCIIEKETISSIKFPKEDVFQDKNKKKTRAYYLNRASQLGNLLKNKVHIYFKDAENNLMRVHTTRKPYVLKHLDGNDAVNQIGRLEVVDVGGDGVDVVQATTGGLALDVPTEWHR